jgi:dihydrofolate reductase
MYETMAVWQTWDVSSEPPVVRDFAEIWRNADKVVYSTTLPAVSTPRTRLERSFDPGAVRALKLASTAPISIGGAELAGHAMRANLIDEYRLFLHPIIVGGGKPALPRLDGPLPLVLVEEKRFGSGVVYLRYDNLRQPR